MVSPNKLLIWQRIVGRSPNFMEEPQLQLLSADLLHIFLVSDCDMIVGIYDHLYIQFFPFFYFFSRHYSS